MPTCQMLDSLSFFAMLRAETSRPIMVLNGDGRCGTGQNNPGRLEVAHARWVGFGPSVRKPVSHLIPTSSDDISGCVSLLGFSVISNGSSEEFRRACVTHCLFTIYSLGWLSFGLAYVNPSAPEFPTSDKTPLCLV
ncbi:hypothetical protein CSHISOI_01703 [Colletotrichum shisoi]|uniref:Uncharacterized protein n=1 Tax=Colletotrichum shisoi TaxID=2078593 RepID=A0A5Q4C329_9PEZI|nr:hypothetical protein CSHISOI_01703 [Colletotrichum shisoi]